MERFLKNFLNQYQMNLIFQNPDGEINQTCTGILKGKNMNIKPKLNLGELTYNEYKKHAHNQWNNFSDDVTNHLFYNCTIHDTITIRFSSKPYF